MTPEEFNALFDTVTRSAFRYEGLPVYAVDDEDEDLVAWREHRPMAERSVRTSPWLARIARQTILDDVDWSRVRQVTSPPSWYVAWEIGSYVESQAAGERILLTGEPVWSGPDFWLLDADTDQARAVVQHYDDDGTLTENELVSDPKLLAELEAAAGTLTDAATPLNVWLVEHAGELRTAEAER